MMHSEGNRFEFIERLEMQIRILQDELDQSRERCKQLGIDESQLDPVQIRLTLCRSEVTRLKNTLNISG